MSGADRRRAVLDTNVLVAGTLSAAGPSGRILAAFRAGRFTLVTSPALLDELVDVLLRPRIRRAVALTEHDVLQLRVAIGKQALVVPGRLQGDFVPEDPDDNIVVAAAMEGKAAFVVSADKAVRSLKVVAISGFRPVQILAPPAFLAELRGR